MRTTQSKAGQTEPSNNSKEVRTLEDFRRIYFPKDANEHVSLESMSKELARKSAILVKSAFANAG